MRFLIDEMFPPEAARLLRDRHGHDAVHVFEVGLAATDDPDIAAAARNHDRALVTENVADFDREREVVLVFVHKRTLPAGGAQASGLAELLDGWANDHPAPYLGAHWPQ